jgi:hypothetical protein
MRRAYAHAACKGFLFGRAAVISVAFLAPSGSGCQERVMPSASPEMLALALAVSLGVLLVVIVRQALSAWLRRRRLLDRFARARTGESSARALLEAHGYDVLFAQAQRSYSLSVDGAEMQIQLRADYVVRRDGLSYVAEVKTGAHAPQIRTGATRRQLLEYRMAFDVDGVLLVDAEQRRVHVIRFPLPGRHPPEGGWAFRWAVIGLGVGVFIASLWR